MPFYTIIINFILVLPLSDKDLNAVILIIDKYIKRITFGARKIT